MKARLVLRAGVGNAVHGTEGDEHQRALQPLRVARELCRIGPYRIEV
jgi:hypothetical protein